MEFIPGRAQFEDLTFHANGSTQIPQLGDIVVFPPVSGNPHGHVAIVSMVSANQVEVIQQNAWTSIAQPMFRQSFQLRRVNGGYTIVGNARGWIHSPRWNFAGTTANYRPLRLFWQGAREDNFTTASLQGEISAAAAGYASARTEGFGFSHSAAGRIPLQQYWHSDRGDNIVVATTAGINDALSAGYSFVRTEGYIYPTPQQHTVPLKLFWSANRQDNFTTSTIEGEQSALAAGYSFVRIEGYVFAARPLQLYWQANRGDNFTTATAEGIASAQAAGYSFVRTEGYVFADPLPDTVPLKLFWNAKRQDNYVTATTSGEAAALVAGYTFVRIEGYVLPTNGVGLRPLELFWHSGRGDNFTTSSSAGATDARNAGYQFSMNEGYLYGSVPAGFSPTATVTSNAQTTHIQWDVVTGATHYFVQYSQLNASKERQTGDNNPPIQVVVTQATEIVIDSPLLQDVRVRSCNSEGCSASITEEEVFTVPILQTFLPAISR